MIKYKTGGWLELIQEVEIEKETEKSVYVRGSRLAKVGQYHRYHDSWADAREFLLRQAENKVEACRRTLEVAKSKLGNIKGLKP